MLTLVFHLPELARYLLLLCRTSGVLMVAPLVGSERLPSRVKLALAATTALVLAPAAGPVPEADGAGYMALQAAGEVVVGLTIGFAARMVFAAVQIAGEMADTQAAFGFAGVVSPDAGERTSVIGQLQMAVAWLVFLAANGHHIVLEGLAASLSAVPLGTGVGFSAPVLTRAAAGLIASGVCMAAPVVGAVMLADFGLGLLGRAAPQMNLLAVGFPIKLAVGLVTALFALPLLVAAEHDLLRTMADIIGGVIAAR